MTELMQTLYTYLEEKRLKEYLPSEYYWHYQRLLEADDAALHAALTDEQWDLLERYIGTVTQRHIMELEALFQAAWAAARELR